MTIEIVGLDADDTLWHSQRGFDLTQSEFCEMLAEFAPADRVAERLIETEVANLERYGYGVKGFILSMIETAVVLTDGRADGRLIGELLAIGRRMIDDPVEPLPGVEEAIALLGERFRLVLITKGDLLHQEQKLARSGLGEAFDDLAIVSEKTGATYLRIFGAQEPGAPTAAMIGNSVRSDVLPAIEIGALGLHVPFHSTWAHEVAEPPVASPLFSAHASLFDAAAWLMAR